MKQISVRLADGEWKRLKDWYAETFEKHRLTWNNWLAQRLLK